MYGRQVISNRNRGERPTRRKGGGTTVLQHVRGRCASVVRSHLDVWTFRLVDVCVPFALSYDIHRAPPEFYQYRQRAGRRVAARLL